MKRHLLAVILGGSLATAGAQTLQVTSSGVGVGTTNPARTLDIGGGYAYSFAGTVIPTFQAVGIGGYSGTYGGAYFVTQSTDTSGGLLVLAKAKSDSIGALAAVQAGDVLGSVLFWGADGSNLLRGGRIMSSAEANASTNNLAANLTFATSTANSYTEQMRITSAGYVGIGTTNPSGQLVINHYGSNNAGDRKTLVFSRTGAGEEFSIGSNGGGTLVLDKVAGTPLADIMCWTQAGYVGVGTSAPGYKLTVSGPVRATQFIADVNTYSDFVFNRAYRLPSLVSVEATIDREGHLPGIPSEAEVRAHGIDLAAMQSKLLEKVEQLTLYVIRLQKENDALRSRVETLETKAQVP